MHRRRGRGEIVRNINYSGNFYLRFGQSSCSCFVSLIFLIFSFHLSLASCIKTHTKSQQNGIKETLFFKIFLGSVPPDPLKVLASLARVGQIRVRPPPPKFLSPYAYDFMEALTVVLWRLLHMMEWKSSKSFQESG